MPKSTKLEDSEGIGSVADPKTFTNIVFGINGGAVLSLSAVVLILKRNADKNAVNWHSGTYWTLFFAGISAGITIAALSFLNLFYNYDPTAAIGEIGDWTMNQ